MCQMEAQQISKHSSFRAVGAIPMNFLERQNTYRTGSGPTNSNKALFEALVFFGVVASLTVGFIVINF